MGQGGFELQSDPKTLKPGVYELPISLETAASLAATEARGATIEQGALSQSNAPHLLSSYVFELLRRRLEDLDPAEQLALTNKLIAALAGGGESADTLSNQEQAVLLSVSSATAGLAGSPPLRPELSIRQSDLLMNARGEPNLARLLKSEMASADTVRIIMSFVKWQGLNLIRQPLRDALDRGVRVQILTTTYMGATDERAVTALAQMGVEVRISYDERSTRLHAKAWLFERNSGFHTGYVGSSNLSAPAMTDGLEWNVRLAHAETPHLLDKFRSAFDVYWEDPNQGFEEFDPVRFPEHSDRLREALQTAGGQLKRVDTELVNFDLRPYRFQQEILDALDRERQVHGRTRSLVVAATGTGKTLVAAFDYRRICDQWRSNGKPNRPKLLFIAHRAEILKQARTAYRHVLRDSQFGELLVEGMHPVRGEHVFATVQSLVSGDRLAQIPSEHFDVVVVDEFHHAAADAWDRVLRHLKPGLLLGLTATPERADGQEVTSWFGHHIAAELRLWEALERGLLCPFHYFAIGNESLDFTRLSWRSGRYDQGEMQALLTGNNALMQWVMRETSDKVADVTRMKALVFTSGIAHADYVAQYLSDHGVAAISLNGQSGTREREEGRRLLATGRIQALVTVDLFNEGVDIPEIDTVMMLRPTESATVFLQQLGRGLRRAEGKSVLTVLDFVGHHRQEFRFDLRLRALTGIARSEIPNAVERGFPYLPSGAQVQLDEVASRLVLENVRNALPNNRRGVIEDIRTHARGRSALEYCLKDYLSEAGLDLAAIYGRSAGSWLELVAAAGLRDAADIPTKALAFRARNLLHVDDLARLSEYRQLIQDPQRYDLDNGSAHARFANMLYLTIFGSRQHDNLRDGLRELAEDRAFVSEALQVLDVAESAISYTTKPLADLPAAIPLNLHARYTRSEMLAALGAADFARSARGQISGVRYVSDIGADVFDMTWAKNEGEYSPQTMYRDYAISDRLVHWQSQNADRQHSDKIQRYINHSAQRSRILLFARESKKYELGTRPYLFLGDAEYVSHEGDRPVSFVWRLKEPMPADFLGRSQLLAG